MEHLEAIFINGEVEIKRGMQSTNDIPVLLVLDGVANNCRNKSSRDESDNWKFITS